MNRRRLFLRNRKEMTMTQTRQKWYEPRTTDNPEYPKYQLTHWEGGKDYTIMALRWDVEKDVAKGWINVATCKTIVEARKKANQMLRLKSAFLDREPRMCSYRKALQERDFEYDPDQNVYRKWVDGWGSMTVIKAGWQYVVRMEFDSRYECLERWEVCTSVKGLICLHNEIFGGDDFIQQPEDNYDIALQ